MKDYDRVIAEFQISIHKQSIENEKYLSSQFEKIIVWVVGLSTGSIALLFSNIDKIIESHKCAVNLTLLLFSMCIFFGVLGRVIDAYQSRITLKSMSLFLQEMKMLSLFDKHRVIQGDEVAMHMIYIIKEDFDFDISDELNEIRRKYPDYSEEQIDQISRDYYKHFSEASIHEIERVQNKVLNSYKTWNGYTDKDWENEKNEKKIGIKFTKSLSRTYKGLYTLSVLSFAFAILLFVLSYIITQG